MFDSTLDIADLDELTTPAIDGVNRRLILTKMVLQWASALRYAVVSMDPTGAPEYDRSESLLVAPSPASAYALAGELGALIDEFLIENVDWSRIDRLADESLRSILGDHHAIPAHSFA